MSYSNFTTLAQVQEKFNLVLEEHRSLFTEVVGVQPSDYLRQTLTEYLPLATAINTEKARSEFLIAPILADIRRQTNYQISLFSGVEFNVDTKLGLNGFCDYLISCSQEQYFIRVPVVTVVEAKNENITGGLGQCIAEMIAAQRFNQNKNSGVSKIYGTVSTGTNWKFLILENQTVWIDSIEYYINQAEKILGILLQPIQLILESRKI